MRILHLVSSLNPAAGGVSQAIVTMAKGLAKEGYISEAATIDNPAATYLSLVPFIVHAKGPGKTAWQYAPPLLRWLQNNLHRYDAVIVHGLWQYPTYAVRKAYQRIKGKKPRLLVMPHGMLDPYFQQAKGRRIKAIRNRLFWKWNESRLVNRASSLLFTCETEKLLARETFTPYRPKQERVIGLGVEAPPPYQDDMKMAFEKKVGKVLTNYWLFISRIHEKKGIDLLVQAYKELVQNGYTLPDLIIAGPGTDTPFGASVEALAADSPIYFAGMLTGDAKWGAFYGCEIFILPSHQENFGIAVVEALACGKPVLISDQVNIWREIRQGDAALVQPDTLAGTQQLLLDWLQLPTKQKQRMEADSLSVYGEYFSEEAATKQLKTVLLSN